MGIAVIISLLIICVVMLIPKRKPTPATYIVCILFIPFAAFQISRLYGAFTLMDYIDTLSASANYVSDGISSVVEDSKLMDNELAGVLSAFVPGVNELQNLVTDLTTQGSELILSVKEYIHDYIIRRAAWLCLILLLSGIGVFLSLSKDTGNAYGNRRLNRHDDRHRARTKRAHRY